MQIPILESATQIKGTRIYEAMYAEPHEQRLHIGLFWTPESARDACIAWYERSGSWTCHTHLCVFVRVVQG